MKRAPAFRGSLFKLCDVFQNKFRYLFILGLAAYSFLNIVLTVNERLFNFEINKTLLLLAVIVIVLGIWELNRFFVHFIGYEQFGKWHPLIVHFLLSIPLAAIAAQIGLILVSLLTHERVFQQENIVYASSFAFRVNLFLHCINSIVYFMNKARKAELQVEKFSKSSLMSRHEALKTQLNPHFLFNSLNALSELIYKDLKKSSQFIDQLSRVYRYFLISNEKSIVMVQEEMSFVDSYLFLLKTRFDQGLQTEIEVEESLYHDHIVPAVLQVLIENAVKHNIIQAKQPLYLKIYSKGQRIYVQNNLQRKETPDASTGMGLRYIHEQYDFLSIEKVEIEETVSSFTVSIPVLKVEL